LIYKGQAKFLINLPPISFKRFRSSLIIIPIEKIHKEEENATMSSIATLTTTTDRTKTESMKPPLPKTKMPPLFDQPVTSKNWTKFVNWPQSILLLATPLIALYGVFTTELTKKTLIWSIVYYFITGLGITAGYHRLWSHRAYRGTDVLRWFMSFAGAGAVEGSIYWWSRGHRAHHR
jgi:stearoyl-CoA desaturase (delta-9 desaturase)